MRVANLIIAILLTHSFLNFSVVAEQLPKDVKPIIVTVKGYSKDGWLPTDQQIEQLEQVLPDEFAKAAKSLSNSQGKVQPLAEYGKRYMGVVGTGGSESGLRLINVFGFCDSERWTENQIRAGAGVDDGGSCYFEGMYNPQTKKFLRFYFNGVG